ncbi:MAG: NAD+ kinase [Spirochaetia bacterium]|nr:NAD+ kinase [Spirochaetia bacterium]
MRAVLAVKRSKWERDLVRYGSRDMVKRLYETQNHNFQRVYDSHKRQESGLERIRTAVPEWPLVFREDLDHIDLSGMDCIVSFGGDNHFVFVSHISRDLPVLGINSDPSTSLGALLYFTTDSFVEKISPGNVKLVAEQWTRIEGRIEYADGRRTTVGPATSEISIRSSFSDAISRYVVRAGEGAWEEQKSSGMLLSTGAGSTGWFRNAVPWENYDSAIFAKEEQLFRFVARETGPRRAYAHRYGTIHHKQVLEMVSEMEGEITVDSHPERTFDFPPGARAEFAISPSNLSVVKDIVPA